MYWASSFTRAAIAPGKRWIAGTWRNSGSRSAAATAAGSSVPRRSLSTSGPANAFVTVTCWSSAKPTRSAKGSVAISALAASSSVKCSRSGGVTCGRLRRLAERRPGLVERLHQDVGGLRARDAVAAAEHEERDAVDADAAGELLVLADRVGVPVGLD